jgi:hypothetical protein
MLLNIFGSEEDIERTDCEAELNKSGTVSEWGNVKQRSKEIFLGCLPFKKIMRSS